ncbi:hypothetical protein K469DRAFT_751070 [Zopfia rhizophila CBS 207.26]|uniref:Uncharacterized protein n=1 Tax=Zopfia rhizophila CBS 207.26 TaxID=1314779 RepID=A0A6A6E2Y6_9PEZI|nr:hypothetical protein K469DRAFT_751070 [Zopfia rhizophila CBS 207.26]
MSLSRASTIGTSIGGRGSGALLASEKVTKHIQGFVPNTQWMTEVRSWVSIGLVTLQYELVKYAMGPTSPLPEGVTVKTPRTLEGRNLCKSTKVPNPGGYQSFSVLGLVTVIVVGGLIFIVSIIVQPLAHYVFRNCSMGNDFRRRQWILDGKLQLQRIAYEHAGIGFWANKEGYVPITTDKAKSFHFDRILEDSTRADVGGESGVRDLLMLPQSETPVEPRGIS